MNRSASVRWWGARRIIAMVLNVFPHSAQIETRHCQKVHKIIRTQYVVVGKIAVFVSGSVAV